MNTVIVPVDFSETSLNAAKYAAGFLRGHNQVNLILYHSHSKEHEKDEIIEKLDELKRVLTKHSDINIEILTYHDHDFVEGLERTARHRNANLIVMGITGKSALAQAFFGSNTLKMVEQKVCPVLIVPENAKFSKMENVMLASDFHNTINTTPSVPIKEFLSIHRPQLHVVNVDKDHYVSITEKYEAEKQDLKKLLGEYNPEFYFMRIYDIDEALEMFANDFHIDIIMAVHKNHSFMDKLFRTNRTKRLSYHSKVPILVIHE